MNFAIKLTAALVAVVIGISALAAVASLTVRQSEIIAVTR